MALHSSRNFWRNLFKSYPSSPVDDVRLILSNRSNRNMLSVLYLSGSKQKEIKEMTLEGEEFRVLVIPGHTKLPPTVREARFQKRDVPLPRYKSMKSDQEWTNVWPSAQTFKWSVVPFPVRQGFIEKPSENDGIPPGKYANAELMKIPNFLHLTPSHVKKHCAVLKHLCTDWPEALKTDADCEKYFPVKVKMCDYIFDGASIRDMRARTVTFQIKLSALDLDYHARDKFIRLAGNNYNSSTDMVTLVADRCPTKKQNYDYATYLLTALYAESWKTESWESEKTLADMEKYFWDLNPSRTTIVKTLRAIKQKSADPSKNASIPAYVRNLPVEPSEEQIVALPEVQEYKIAVNTLLNDGENRDSINKYKEVVKRLLLNTDKVTQ